ncbi:acetyltransferase [Clostridium sp. AF37-5AT]|nr:acetyltransferase [Clostridium sp. AF37-5AT]RHP71075.1 acetyltransferase [Clostridium sp. OF03-18AA]
MAQSRALRHQEFWTLVFSTGKISYSEWAQMDLGEFYEAREAYLNFRQSISDRQSAS